MTDSITPPPELVSKWCHEDGEEIKSSPRWFFSVFAKAAQWGADTELEACCEWLIGWDTCEGERLASLLREGRRPKPPSLKEQALQLLETYNTLGVRLTADQVDTIKRALEALND